MLLHLKIYDILPLIALISLSVVTKVPVHRQEHALEVGPRRCVLQYQLRLGHILLFYEDLHGVYDVLVGEELGCEVDDSYLESTLELVCESVVLVEEFFIFS